LADAIAEDEYTYTFFVSIPAFCSYCRRSIALLALKIYFCLKIFSGSFYFQEYCNGAWSCL